METWHASLSLHNYNLRLVFKRVRLTYSIKLNNEAEIFLASWSERFILLFGFLRYTQSNTFTVDNICRSWEMLESFWNSMEYF